MATERPNHLDLGVSAIMQFRFAYLRTIAEAWEDEDRENPAGGGKSFQALVWKAEDTSDYEDYENQVKWNVMNSKKSRAILRHFKYETPWDVLVNIVWRKEGPRYLDGKWGAEGRTYAMHDKFIINLPGVPGPKEIWAEALAAYYQAFPTLFGVRNSIDLTTPGQVVPQSRELGAINGKANKKDSVKPRGVGTVGVSGHEPSDFIDFGGTILQILAKTWSDPAFAQKCNAEDAAIDLPDIPEERKADEWKTFLDEERIILAENKDLRGKTQMLKMIREIWPEFENIWNFRILFNIVEGYKFEDGKWNDLPKNVIQLNYPHKPVDLVDEPSALASYNATGVAYSLTCY